jgi:hypothetical protein
MYFEGEDWIHLTQDWTQWVAVVNTMMNFGFCRRRGISWAMDSCQLMNKTLYVGIRCLNLLLVQSLLGQMMGVILLNRRFIIVVTVLTVKLFWFSSVPPGSERSLWAQLYVSNTRGVGTPPAIVSILFHPFTRFISSHNYSTPTPH